MKPSSAVYYPRVLNVLGAIACTVLALMLGIVAWSWIDSHGWRMALAVPVIVASAVWLLHRPVWLLALWLGLRG